MPCVLKPYKTNTSMVDEHQRSVVPFCRVKAAADGKRHVSNSTFWPAVKSHESHTPSARHMSRLGCSQGDRTQAVAGAIDSL